MRHNAVAIARLILLSLQAHLHILVLVAAAWNVSAAHSAGEPSPAAAVFLILASLAFIGFFSLGAIVWCLKLPLPLLTSIKFECGWSTVLLVIQLGATIGATVHVPSRGSAPAISTSHALLVPAAWLTAIVAALYVVALILVVRAHKLIFPEIWSAPAYSADWFVHAGIDAENVENDSWTRHLNDIEAAGIKKQPVNLTAAMEAAALADINANAANEKAPWAQSIRRGVDNPFASVADPARSSTPLPKVEAELPPLPLRVKAKTAAAGSRFIERFRESWVPVRTSPFAALIADLDKPIPVPRGVEWLKADAHAQ
ncbi:hypothetical protein GGX14DRAFT_590456 [Mycena pura]|uniref:MARVEL domain-containing protein n=1 Tax=Mycena pura TaxID=153505 RepID=A0AAD6YI98_9AGAR|nr:hypothetical protein GGX14DRAFT_590456 [Mycena pura]